MGMSKHIKNDQTAVMAMWVMTSYYVIICLNYGSHDHGSNQLLQYSNIAIRVGFHYKYSNIMVYN